MKQVPEELRPLGERARHGTDDFSIGWYPRLSQSWKEYFFVPHWHSELELLVVEEGVMELVVGGHSYVLNKGAMVLFPPNVLHTAYRVETKHCCFSCAVFSEKFISSVTLDTIQKKVLIPLFISDFSENYLISTNGTKLNEQWEHFSKALSFKGPLKYLMVKGLLLQILSEILLQGNNSFSEKQSESIRSKREKKILNFLDDHFSEILTLDTLATSLNLSKEQFSRFFRQSFRQSPMQYLTQFRLQKACHLLINSDWSVEEIAQATGFDNGNYFSRVFKKHLLTTPSEFRKKDMIVLINAMN